MKLLQKPWVAGGLAVLAVAVVCYVVLLPQLRSGSGTKATQTTSAAATTASKGSASVAAPPPKTIPPQVAIDRNYVQTHLAGWLEAPPRDPFLLAGAPRPEKKVNPEAPSPVLSWKLKAIWRQTGGSLAAINNGVFREGDEIQGYKLERIETDRVWFQGPDKKESLDFNKLEMAAANAPQGTNFIERFLGPEKVEPIRPRL